VQNFVKIGQTVFEISRFFLFFKMVAAAILDFRNSQILLAGRVCRAEIHQHAKFRQNLTICCKVIAILRFFKMAAAAILDLFGAYLDHLRRIQ